jgi:hypothetical protein
VLLVCALMCTYVCVQGEMNGVCKACAGNNVSVYLIIAKLSICLRHHHENAAKGRTFSSDFLLHPSAHSKCLTTHLRDFCPKAPSRKCSQNLVSHCLSSITKVPIAELLAHSPRPLFILPGNNKVTRRRLVKGGRS